VVSYGNEVPIEACKELSIPTVELQHGVISARHLGYAYGHEKARKRLFPDWLFLFGEFWREAAAFPIPPERVRAVGWAYLERRRLEQPRIERKQQVLFLSQKTIGHALSRIAVELAGTPGVEHEVVYKLHPGERLSWRKDYPWLGEAKVRVVDGDEPHLYELLAESSAQVGVYSTALYEGLVFGLDTFVARLPGSDVMTRLVEHSGQTRWVDGVRSLAEALRDPPGFRDETGDYFRPDAVDHFKEAVADVLAGRRSG